MISLDWIIFWVLFGLFCITAFVVTFVILSRLRWNYRWVLLEEQPNGKLMIVKRGKCRKVAFSDGGEEIFYIKGLNKWRVAYGKLIGKNQIAWATGQDGYWYNIDFGSLDKKLREIGVYPVDRDMRYAYASTKKGIDNRYDKKNFMEKYGTIIAFGMLFLCIIALGISQYINVNGQVKASDLNQKTAETNKETMDLANQVLSNIYNIKTSSSASGAVPAK